MPNGYESPLNKLADALPTFILQMQNMRMRQEAQEALNSYRAMMMNERISAREAQEEATRAMEQMGRMTGRYDPPEVDVLSKRIEKDLDVLRDPDIALELGAEDINTIKSRVKSNIAERRRLSGREYYVDPSLIRITPKEEIPKIDAAIVAPPAKTRSEIELEKLTASKRRDPAWMALIARAETRVAREKAEPPAPEVAPAVEEIPPEFPGPSGFPEGQTATFNGEPWIIRNGQWMKVKRAGKPIIEQPAPAAVVEPAPAAEVPPSAIPFPEAEPSFPAPEGATRIWSGIEGAFIYTVDEETWISEKTGQPVKPENIPQDYPGGQETMRRAREELIRRILR